MKVAVVGATGLVGTRMMEVLAERNFPVTELFPVASARSVGKEVVFKGEKIKVMSADEAIARQPESSGDIRTSMIIAAALIEGVCFFAIIVCVLAIFM